MALLIDLQGKKGLIIGVANEHSIAYGCARVFQLAGAELAITYLNEKAEKYVRPLAQDLKASIILPYDVQNEDQSDDLFSTIAHEWGGLDFMLHSIAYAPQDDLQCRLASCSNAGFLQAMDISCHSFIALTRRCMDFMKPGSSILTVTYMGSSEVIPHYGLMGTAKAALEAATRYLAAELGPKGIRVNAISPGPISTRAASGILGFGALLSHAKEKAPLHRNIDLEDVGNLAAFLVSDLANNITGGVHYVDAGYHVVD